MRAEDPALPRMYGKKLTSKNGGVDVSDCAKILRLFEHGKIDTIPLIMHRYELHKKAACLV